MSARAAAPRIIAFYVTTFAVMGVFMPFWPVWLDARGLDEEQIGVVVSAGILVRVLTPWLAQRIDEIGRTRATALALISTSTVLFAAFHLAHGFVALLTLNVLLGVAFMMIYPLTDNLAARTAGEHYGRLRLFGSLSFLLAAWCAGYALDVGGVGWIYGIVLAAFLASVGAAAVLPEHERDPAVDEPSTQRPLRRVLQNRRFLRFAAGCGVIQASHAGLYAFSALHWQDCGIDESTIGALWAVSVVAEIVLFQFGARVTATVSPLALAAVGGGCAIVRWCALTEATSPAVLFPLQVLHAGSFAATHLGIITFIRRERLGVTGISIYSAVGTGIGMAGATFGAGFAFEAWGAGMFWLMAGIACLGSAVALASGGRET